MSVLRTLHAWGRRRAWPWRLIGGLVVVLGALLLTPTRPAAACGFSDGGCLVDQGMYNAMLIVARALWAVNRLILLVAYLLDIIRSEIITNLFLGPYTQLTALVGAAIVPVATLAIIVAMLAILLAPVSGMPAPFNIRQIMVIVLIAPPLLLSLGTALGDLDTLRVDLADQLYAAATNGGAGFVGSIAADSGDMPAPEFLYPGSCPAAQGGADAFLPRHTGGQDTDRVLRPDELAAAYLYAGTADIHCDYASGSEIAGLPAQWADADTPGYAHADDIGDQDAATRTVWKDRLNAGIIRLVLGLIVSTLALVYYAAHLVFTLALVALWVSFPFGVLFGMFKRDFGWAGDYLTRAFDTLKQSWVTSFIIGLLTAGLVAAAQSGNANVFAGLATATLTFLVFTLSTALATLRSALTALTSLASGALGGASGGANLLGSASGMVGMAALGAAGGVTQGVGQLGRMGAIAHAATRESGSRTYGIAAALGRSDRLMQVGEIARSMGLLHGEGGDAIVDAMRVGHASNHSVKAFNQRLKSSPRAGTVLEQAQADREAVSRAKADAKQQHQADAAEAAARQRQIAQLGRLRDGNVAQRSVTVARAFPGMIGARVQAVKDVATTVRGQIENASAVDPTFAAIGALSAGGSAVRTHIRYSIGRSRTTISAGRSAVLLTARRAARTAQQHMDPDDRFAAAWQMNPQGQLQRIDDPDAATPPADARRGAFSNAELHHDLRAGATVRFHDDHTASVWGGAGASDADAPSASEASVPPTPPPSTPEMTLTAMRARHAPRLPRRVRSVRRALSTDATLAQTSDAEQRDPAS